MALREYRRKRHFGITREPSGAKQPRRGPRRIFVIHHHFASREHYDLRLEHRGVLKSWAVPKEPATEPGEKRLAVQVEDHPLEYASFRGTIPEGQYGAGKVMIWDRGTWEPEGNPGEGLDRGRLSFRLSGRKLKGNWTLVRMRGDPKSAKQNWLLIKRADEPSTGRTRAIARPRDPPRRRGTRVKTGRARAR
ncbi:MAG: DNA polymerase ligase N-terminal domain-containing protein [Gemmatimonadales bacterium]